MDYSNPDFLYSRCSICYDESLDFCLRRCRDQFCTDCFSHYIQEIIQSSWGLHVAQVKCPVCSDVIPYSEWTEYVDEDLVDLYDKFNQPFKVMSRSCTVCHHDIPALKSPIGDKSLLKEQFTLIYEDIHELLTCVATPSFPLSSTPSLAPEDVEMTERKKEKNNDDHSLDLKEKNNDNDLSVDDEDTDNHEHEETTQHLETNRCPPLTFHSKTTLEVFEKNYLNHLDGGYMSVYFIYTSLFADLAPALGYEINKKTGRMNIRDISDLSPFKYQQLSSISNRLISLETKPDNWMKLQFIHIHNFPKIVCKECGEDHCFSCGSYPYHDKLTCEQYTKLIFRSTELQDQICQHQHHDKLTLFWKLGNSKRCPRCSVQIYRDEGCHQVDCVFCGYSFCWICLEPFELGKCGYYQCKEKNSLENKVIEDKPENGVPNVQKLFNQG